MKSRALARIRKLVEEGKYEVSNHALDEELDDDIHRVAIATGVTFDVRSAPGK